MIARFRGLVVLGLPAVLLYFSALPRASAEELSRPEPVESDCGVCALYSILRLEGIEADIPSILKALPKPAAGGRSMKDLRDAAAGWGLSLDCIRIREGSRRLDRPMIALLRGDEGGHFVVVRPVGHTGNLIQIIDDGREPSVEDWSRFFSDPTWTGYILVRRNRLSDATLLCSALCFVALLIMIAARRYRRVASRFS